MATLPLGLIFTDSAGLARAQPGMATVWMRNVFASRSTAWKHEKGTIYLKWDSDANGAACLVPMFRGFGNPLEDVPLSTFDGYTQP